MVQGLCWHAFYKGNDRSSIHRILSTAFSNKDLSPIFRDGAAPGSKTYPLLDTKTSMALESCFKGCKILSDVYHMPRNNNQSAFDSFIVHCGHLYIFQSIGDEQHDIREGLLPFLTTCTRLPPHYNWQFILVLPDDVGLLKYPVPQNTEFQQLGIFLSVIAVEDEKPGFSSKSKELRIQSLQTEPTKIFLTIYRCGKCCDHIRLLVVGHM